MDSKIGQIVGYSHPTMAGIFPAIITAVSADGQRVALTVFSMQNPFNVGPVEIGSDPATGKAHRL